MAPTETATLIQIEKPAPPAIVAELHPIVAAARAFKVNSKETHAEALTRAKKCRSGEKGIEDHFDKMKKAAAAAHKEAVAAVAALVGPIAEARQIYDKGAAVYEADERRKAADEERRLQEKARLEEEERQLAAAQQAQDRGDKAEAEAIVSEPVSTPVITVAPATAKVEGVSDRKSWSAEIHSKACRNYAGSGEDNCRCYDTGLLELVQYVAAHPEWLSFLKPDMPNLNRLAVAQRNSLSIPGVRAVEKSVRSYR